MAARRQVHGRLRPAEAGRRAGCGSRARHDRARPVEGALSDAQPPYPARVQALPRPGDGMMAAHRWHQPRNVSSARPTATPAAAHLVADHRFSEEELAGLLSALRERAQAHPDNPGLVACWPAVPAEKMAAACGLLARRGHSVQPVTVALWDRERTRDGWTLGTPPHDVAPTPDRAEIVARSDTLTS